MTRRPLLPWQPVLEGTDAARAREAIGRIAASLVDLPELTDPSLIRGWAGIALLHGYLARDGTDEASDRAHDALGRALELLETGAPLPWLGTGFVGVAWVMQHLDDVVSADQDTLRQIDEMVAGLLARETWPFEYELWEGVVGLGVYALERGNLGNVTRAIALLDRLAERTSTGVTWWNRDFVDFTLPDVDPRGYHNLGLALGVAGVASFLAAAAAAGHADASPLLAETIRWLLAQERDGVSPRFPGCVGLEVPAERVRNGWCYGDGAIACAVVRAGIVANQPDWVAHGRRVARAMASHPGPDVPDVDAAFCHGTAGRAHMFQRLGVALRDPLLLDAARRCSLETLDRIAAIEPATPNLTTGSSGIALALLAAVSSIEPDWDRVFLLAQPQAV